MQKILIISRNFPPLIGGMERLVFNIYRQLGKQHECGVIGPPGSGSFLRSQNQSYECRLQPVPFFVLSATFKGLWASCRNKYTICIAGSGLTAPAVVIASKLCAMKSVTFVHGLDLIVKSRIYQLVFLPFIRRSDIVVANSHNTARLARKAGIPEEKIVVLHPGVDIPDKPSTRRDFRKQYNLEGKSLLLSAGRLVPRKGLAEFIRYSLPAVVERHEKTMLVIIGSEPENALKRTNSVVKDIQSAMEERGLEDNVLMTGRVDDDVLAAAYEEADCFVFPLLDVSGDVEGFGMVAVEAAAHGLPTIAFNAGGVGDAIAEGESGFLLAPGDYEGFGLALIKCLDDPGMMPPPASCRSFAERFDWDRFGEKLGRIINSPSAKASPES
jgi:phosphatidylinositol alpha-1,6-mannosyltransferase